MSGILMAAAVSGERLPFLTDRSLSVTGGIVDAIIELSFETDGRLRTQDGVGTPVFTDRTPEWDGRNIASDIGSQYQVRATIVSGNVGISAEFNSANVWYNLTSRVRFRSNQVDQDAVRNGVWRVQIRRTSDQIVVTSADYTVSVDCSDCD